MFHGKKVTVVIPTYNAERTIERTVNAVPRPLVDDVIIINDASPDSTISKAEHLNALLITHPKNTGYGGSQKTGYKTALERGAQIIIMVHGDYQYDPALIPEILEPFKNEHVDAVFGSRMQTKGSARAGGMHWWRFAANVALSTLEEWVFGLHLTEYHTGYRAYRSNVLRAIPFALNSNNYVFDTEFIAELALGHFKVAEVAIPTRYEKDSLSPSFLKSVEYGLMSLAVIGKFLLQRAHLGRFKKFAVHRG